MAQTTFPELENPLHRLTPEQIEQIGVEFDALHDEVFDDLGERDAVYIRSMISFHRRLVLIGRTLLIGSRFRPFWLAGTATLSIAKILENMEIGHNVMHGQWDWMNDPQINSSAWDWDSASTAEAWKHSHNYVHHTYTNIRGLDHDLGCEILRIDPHQKWNPVYLLQPLYNVLLMAFFEWGVAFHDLNFDDIRSGAKSKEQVKRELKGMAEKARAQIVKDYVAFPALSGLVMLGIDLALAARSAELEEMHNESRSARAKRAVQSVLGQAQPTEGKGVRIVRRLVERRSFRQPFRSTLTADFTANIVRNLWAHAIIFCGHFPDQTYSFSQEETADESRGARHVRQLLGAANIEGSPLFHVLSGNLGYQVEHHLFPDMPSTRYAEIAPRVREICERHGLPYNTGGKPRPKPGPYHGEKIKNSGERETRLAGSGV